MDFIELFRGVLHLARQPRAAPKALPLSRMDNRHCLCTAGGARQQCRGVRVRGPAIATVTALSLLTLAGCERYALDRQMEALCKRDGGIKVYETVTLPTREYEVIWKYADTARSPSDYYGPDYRAVSTAEILVGKDTKAGSGEGRLKRLYWAIYRRSDGRLLGEQVEYRRNGGDFFTFGFEASSAYCPRVDFGLAHYIFIKGN